MAGSEQNAITEWGDTMAKDERLQIRITPELKAQLRKLADADGRTVSNYVEKLIKDAIEKRTK